MHFAKPLAFILVLVFALFACSDNVEAPVRPGLGEGPVNNPVPINGGPYLYYFDFDNMAAGYGDLHMVASTEPATYSHKLSQNPVQRNSVVMSYDSRISLATSRSINLLPAEMFYIDSGKLYRTNVSVSGDLRELQISSKSDFGNRVCDQTSNAFLNIILATVFLIELPGIDNDCANRDDNIILRISEDDYSTEAPLDITVNLKNGATTPPLLRNIERLLSLSGGIILDGYLVVQGTSLLRFDVNFNLTNTIDVGSPTTLELGSAGIGFATGITHFVTIDDGTTEKKVYQYVDDTLSVDMSVPLYTLPVSATIDAHVCKKEECLFVENKGGTLTLYVIKTDGSAPAVKLMSSMQNVEVAGTVTTNVFDSVTTIIRSAEKITFTVTDTAPATSISLYQIDISALTSNAELHLETTNIDPALMKLVDTGNSIDLFRTSGEVYYNKDYQRIHNVIANTSIAVVLRADPNVPESTMTEYTFSAWVGVADTEVSRQQVIEKIILAHTIDKPVDPAADPIVLTGLPETNLTAYNTATHTVSAVLGALIPEGETEVDVVHMSFQMVGNKGLGDVFITSADNAATLQSDIYYIDALVADSLTRVTNTLNDNQNESAIATCGNAGSLFCR